MKIADGNSGGYMENKCYEGFEKILKAQSLDEMKSVVKQYDVKELEEIIILIAYKLKLSKCVQDLMKLTESVVAR